MCSLGSSTDRTSVFGTDYGGSIPSRGSFIMIYIVQAMRQEAAPIIQHFHLKKSNLLSKWEVFQNLEIIHITTGIGKLSSAIATTALLSKFNLSPKDIILNIGIAGTNDTKIPINSCFLVHKILELSTKKTLYPDILFSPPILTKELITSDTLVHQSADQNSVLYDMEGFGFFKAASKFLELHQIGLIKIVSDHIQPEEIIVHQIRELIWSNISVIDSILQLYLKIPSLSLDFDKSDYIGIAENLKFTETMKQNFIHLCISYQIRTKRNLEVLNQYRTTKIKNKTESKKVYEKIILELSRFEELY